MSIESPSVDEVDTANDIVHVIMTQHWDLAACDCWVCCAGRRAGLHPTSVFLGAESRGFTAVHVDGPMARYRLIMSDPPDAITETELVRRFDQDIRVAYERYSTARRKLLGQRGTGR